MMLISHCSFTRFFPYHVRILCTTRIQCRTTTTTTSSSAAILISAITATVTIAPLLSIHGHFMPRCLVLHACSVAGGLDVSRLEQVEALARDAAKNHMSPQEADNELVKIVAQKPMYVLVSPIALWVLLFVLLRNHWWQLCQCFWLDTGALKGGTSQHSPMRTDHACKSCKAYKFRCVCPWCGCEVLPSCMLAVHTGSSSYG